MEFRARTMEVTEPAIIVVTVDIGRRVALSIDSGKVQKTLKCDFLQYILYQSCNKKREDRKLCVFVWIPKPPRPFLYVFRYRLGLLNF